MTNGLRIGVAGVVIGMITAVVGAHVASSLLYGVAASDPLTLIGVAILLLGTLTLACLQPAWRACRIAPREALS